MHAQASPLLGAADCKLSISLPAEPRLPPMLQSFCCYAQPARMCDPVSLPVC